MTKTQGLTPCFLGGVRSGPDFHAKSLGTQDGRFYRRAVLWPNRAYNGILALALAKGGDSGPVILANQLESSPLLDRIP